jgi:recombination protein RecA
MADLKDLNSLINSLEKKFGDGSVTMMSQASNNIERWPLKSLNLTDLTCGGLPRGRIIEIYGLESSGKTTLATIIAADIQSQGGNIAYLDVENSFDPIYSKSLNLDISKCIFSQPADGETAIDIAEELVKSKKIDLIIVDSVASLTPKAEIAGETSDQFMGLQARLMGKACRKLSAILSETKTTIIFINQIRMKIGVLYGNPETTPGGLALKFYSSIRMEVRKSEWIEEGTGDNKKKIGFISNIKTVKNKVGIPFKKREMTVIFGRGLQLDSEFVDFALETGVLQRKGTWYFYEDEKLGQGKEQAISFLLNNIDLKKKIEKETRERISKIDLNSISINMENKSMLDETILEENKIEELEENNYNTNEVSVNEDDSSTEIKKRGRKPKIDLTEAIKIAKEENKEKI